MSTNSASVRLTLDVTYSLNGEDAEELIARLVRAVEHSIGEGMLTGTTASEVDTFTVKAGTRQPPPSESEISSFMLSRIESGDLALEDIPDRLTTYGLMDPDAFAEEMRERMEANDSDGEDCAKSPG